MEKLGRQNLFKPNNLYIISDVHAEHLKLERIINKIKKTLEPADHIVFVGDIIGRKLSNIPTFLTIEKLIKDHPNTFIIEGNHESSFIQYMNMNGSISIQYLLDPEILSEFAQNGVSTKPDIIDFLNQKGITFLHNLIPYYESDNVIISHAPIESNALQFRGAYEGVLEDLGSDLMWMFTEKSDEKIPVRFIKKWTICGHQNHYSRRIKPDIYPDIKRAFLDCGCGYQDDKALYALNFNNMEILSSDD